MRRRGVHPEPRKQAWASTLLVWIFSRAVTAASPPLASGTVAFQSITGSYLQSNFTAQAVTVADVLGFCQSGAPPLPLVEATIASVQAAFLARRLSCTQLVQAYVQRIRAYDQHSGVNSIRVINPSLAQDAAGLDGLLAGVLEGQEQLPKLFCVPMLVKDNFDTKGMAASNGAAGLLDNFAPQDAHQIQLLKKAGAVILGKSNMGEWAFSPDISVGSTFGVVRNPYATDYSTAGSSGGTAAGVAANFALAGLGTDTGNSVRGPAGWNSLVGLRPSLGLSSRTGIIPLDSTSDVGGPLARSVEDAVRVFEVTVGVDPADNLTSLQNNYTIPSNYTQFLRSDGLKGKKIGVMRQTINAATADATVMQLFERALQDLTSAGATIVDNFTITGNSLGSQDWSGDSTWTTGFGSAAKVEQLECGARFKYDINVYLSTSASAFKAVEPLVAQGLIHPSINASMMVRLGIPYTPAQYPPQQLRAQGYLCSCSEFYSDPCRSEFRKRLVASMDAAGVSVLVFPTWSNPPPLIGNYGQPTGNNSPQISPPTGAPAMVVPMGFTKATLLAPPLPASLQFLARPFDEAALIEAAFSYEQVTNARRPPPAFPECAGLAPGPGPSGAVSSRNPAFLGPSYNSLG